MRIERAEAAGGLPASRHDQITGEDEGRVNAGPSCHPSRVARGEAGDSGPGGEKGSQPAGRLRPVEQAGASEQRPIGQDDPLALSELPRLRRLIFAAGGDAREGGVAHG